MIDSMETKTFTIIKYPAKILGQPAQEVIEINPAVLALILQMEQAMEKNDGIGLAAPQIGVAERIIIVKDAKENHAFLNTEVVSRSKATITDEEGCLSLPGIFVKVKRSKQIKVACKTPESKEITIEAAGLGARIFQHEIDHLQGKLIINRISPFARLKLLPKLWKLKT